MGDGAGDGVAGDDQVARMLAQQGAKVGGAIISQEHGNFLVNAGGATANVAKPAPAPSPAAAHSK